MKHQQNQNAVSVTLKLFPLKKLVKFTAHGSVQGDRTLNCSKKKLVKETIKKAKTLKSVKFNS